MPHRLINDDAEPQDSEIWTTEWGEFKIHEFPRDIFASDDSESPPPDTQDDQVRK